jgi:hypothetical protein
MREKRFWSFGPTQASITKNLEEFGTYEEIQTSEFGPTLKNLENNSKRQQLHSFTLYKLDSISIKLRQ